MLDSIYVYIDISSDIGLDKQTQALSFKFTIYYYVTVLYFLQILDLF